MRFSLIPIFDWSNCTNSPTAPIGASYSETIRPISVKTSNQPIQLATIVLPMSLFVLRISDRNSSSIRIRDRLLVARLKHTARERSAGLYVRAPAQGAARTWYFSSGMRRGVGRGRRCHAYPAAATPDGALGRGAARRRPRLWRRNRRPPTNVPKKPRGVRDFLL